MTLSQDVKEVLAECRDALKRNDLLTVYHSLMDALHEGAIDYDDIGNTTLFFEEKGIHLEDYLDMIPSLALGGKKSWPKRWEQKKWGQSVWLVIPPNIKHIAPDAFGGSAIRAIDASNVKVIEPYAFSHSDLRGIIVGKQTKLCDDSLAYANFLQTIYVPDEQVGQNILMYEPVIRYSKDADIVDINTGEVYNGTN